MRSLVLYLSLATLVFYGYALAGLGGYYLGRGRMDYIVWGLLLGTLCALTALWLWSRHKKSFYISSVKDPEDQ